jgi:hypothetical protein
MVARDFLSIMASSVSSERAFSSAGITISKRRNRLKGDIVEALQVLKCLYRKELIFREVVTVAEEEDDMDWEELEEIVDNFSWDEMVLDIGDDDIESST